MRFKWLYFLISGIVILPGVFSLIKWGLRPSIDFTGGTLLELEFTQAIGDKQKVISEALNELEIEYSSIQLSGEKRILIKAKPITREDVSSIIGTVAEKAGEKLSELRFDTVGPILGKELIKKTIIAILLAAGFIMLYVWKQFKE
ncbi:hypothetical protein COT03_02000, partial [Candidatus Shapirobacteria bacterium CG07_land_8_20_14_0_80_39_18]